MADDIRNSEGPFVEAAILALRKTVEMEYYRLRGYAIEEGSNEIDLNLVLRFNFNAGAQGVTVQSVPVFQPQPQTQRAKVMVVAKSPC